MQNYPLNPAPQNDAPMASINLGEQAMSKFYIAFVAFIVILSAILVFQVFQAVQTYQSWADNREVTVTKRYQDLGTGDTFYRLSNGQVIEGGRYQYEVGDVVE